MLKLKTVSVAARSVFLTKSLKPDLLSSHSPCPTFGDDPNAFPDGSRLIRGPACTGDAPVRPKMLIVALGCTLKLGRNVTKMVF